MKTLFLHVGAQKTGSSMIQGLLRASREQLRSVSILFDHVGSGLGVRLKAASPLAADELAHWRHVFTANLGRGPERIVVLSSENFFGSYELGYPNTRAIAEDLRAIFGAFDVRIIAYTRRQDTFIESCYHQQIKEGGSLSFAEYKDQCGIHSYKWNELLDHYSAVFGAGNVTVFPHEMIRDRKAFVTSFFSILGINFSVPFDALQPVNPGYSRHGLRIARLCNSFLSQEERVKLHEFLAKEFSKPRGESFDLFEPGERDCLLESYRDANRALFETYLSGYDAGMYL